MVNAPPGLLVVLMAGPWEMAGEQRLKDALRLLETLGAMDELRLRLVMVGEGARWLKPDLGELDENLGSPMSDDAGGRRIGMAVEDSATDDEGPLMDHSWRADETEGGQKAFLESLDILLDLGVKVGLCQVAARTCGVEGRAMKLGIALVPFTQEVARACKNGWRLLGF